MARLPVGFTTPHWSNCPRCR